MPTRLDISNIQAKLASADTYKNAGVDYPYNVPKIKFEVEQRANGEPYVKVTTVQPVNEPFVYTSGRIELVFRQVVARIYFPS